MDKKIIVWAGAAVIAAAVIVYLFQTLRVEPTPEPVLKEHKTVGLLHYRQQDEAAEGVKQGLRELGYEDITFLDGRHSPGPDDEEFMKNAVREFLEQGADLIFAGLEFQAKAALEVTKEMNRKTPIVFLSQFHDPVKFGLAESFVSSGNNSTGVALNIVEVVQKQLEFVGEINPDIKRIGVFTEGFMIPHLSDEFFPEFKRQAERFGYEVVEYTTTAPPPEAEKAWQQVAAGIEPGEIDAIYHLAGHFYEPQEAEETKLAARVGALHIAPLEDLPTGGHFGYSGDFTAAGKQAAVLADKIFRGERPTDIPLEHIRKHSLVLYTGRAREAGIEFPEPILLIADKIVE